MINICVLIPLYNGIEFIDECIVSLNNQKYQNFDVLIGINGHKKNSDVFIKANEYKKQNIIVKEYFYNKNNDKYVNYKSLTLNKMLKDCDNYDYICLLDIDDIWLPNKLKMQVEIIEKYNNYYDVIGSKCHYIGNKYLIPYTPIGDLSDHNFKDVNPIINSSCLIKKELCYWNEHEKLEDYDLWLKLNNNGAKMYNLDEVLILHRLHETSFFNSKIDSNEKDKIIKKY